MPAAMFTFEAFGIQEARVRFNRLGAAAIDLSPAWADILEYFYWMEDATFQSQGRRGGGSWADDTDDWLARKAREGLDPRINFATWALYDSMTMAGAEGQVIDVGPQELKFGSSLPQAGPSQRFRPFVKLTVQDRWALAEAIKEHFRMAWDGLR